jgi:hypothetical protein
MIIRRLGSFVVSSALLVLAYLRLGLRRCAAMGSK